MRTQEEINEAIEFFNSKNTTDKVEAIIYVLENDIDDDEIEEMYFDENDPWIEQAALSARGFLNGSVELEDIY